MNVGVIGLGAGTLATYARPIDHYTFYDINPLVPAHRADAVPLSARTAWRRTKSCWAMRVCRWRREPSQQFDVLAVDAFSGDAIPVHLLTRRRSRFTGGI